MARMGLHLAREKTAAVFLSTRRAGREKEEWLELGGETPILIGKKLKYLGVVLEANPRMSSHIAEAAEAARKTDRAIARLMPNVGGPGEGRRKLLATAARAKLLYAAPIWAAGLSAERNRARFRRATRTGLLRIARAYRTVSTDALEALAAMLPIGLAARAGTKTDKGTREGMNRAEARKVAEEEAYLIWQNRWEANTGWTRRLIANIEEWRTRKHGTLTYHLTQILTGYGCFRTYLKRIGKAETGECAHCPGIEDTAEHTLVSCPRWESERTTLQGTVGEVSTDTIVRKMLISEANWNAVATFAWEVLETKDRQPAASGAGEIGGVP